jgi:hypothetical protein
VPQLAAGQIPNRQVGIPDSRVGRAQLPQDKLGATANRSAANIRITIESLATLISRFSNIFVLGSSQHTHGTRRHVVL